jgi:hypothetical protein
MFPMFPTVPDQLPSARHDRLCRDTLRDFSSKQHDKGRASSAIFEAFMNMYMKWVVRPLEP